MSIELKPCPFCGSTNIDPEGVASFKPEFRSKDMTWDRDATPERLEHHPACQDCDATTGGDWNVRAGSGRPVRLAWAHDKLSQIPAPTEDDLQDLVTKIWKDVKPSQEAQRLRSRLAGRFDSGKYSNEDFDFMPEYVCDILDIAIQTGLNARLEREMIGAEVGFSPTYTPEGTAPQNVNTIVESKVNEIEGGK